MGQHLTQFQIILKVFVLTLIKGQGDQCQESCCSSNPSGVSVRIHSCQGDVYTRHQDQCCTSTQSRIQAADEQCDSDHGFTFPLIHIIIAVNDSFTFTQLGNSTRSPRCSSASGAKQSAADQRGKLGHHHHEDTPSGPVPARDERCPDVTHPRVRQLNQDRVKPSFQFGFNWW